MQISIFENIPIHTPNRKNIIYEPTGRALEYSPLAANLYQGCAHACTYCFGPANARKTREEFHNPDYIKPRGEILYHLEKDAKGYAGDPRPILLSFITDPYQPIEKDLNITREALKILMANELIVTILTKGGTWGLLRDIDLLQMNPANSWAVTLTCDTPDQSKLWEPYAALPDDRIESLRIAHAHRIKTWVSFEPVLYPKAVYRLLDKTYPFVDHYKVGKLNENPHARTINWKEFREEIIYRLEKLGKSYYLKKDLVDA